MSRLEQRYRLVLRVLPAAYRKAWEEDMVATFLDSVDSDDAEAAEYVADYGRPSWSEVATVASLAVRRCLGAAGAPPRYVAWGQTVRLVALTGLLVNAAAATIEAGSTLWLATASRLGGGLRRSHDGGHAHRARTDSAAPPKCSRLGRLGGALQHPTAPSGHRSGATGHAVPVGSGRPAADRRPSRRWWPGRRA